MHAEAQAREYKQKVHFFFHFFMNVLNLFHAFSLWSYSYSFIPRLGPVLVGVSCQILLVIGLTIIHSAILFTFSFIEFCNETKIYISSKRF